MLRRVAPLFNHRAMRDTTILHPSFSIFNYCLQQNSRADGNDKRRQQTGNADRQTGNRAFGLTQLNGTRGTDCVRCRADGQAHLAPDCARRCT